MATTSTKGSQCMGCFKINDRHAEAEDKGLPPQEHDFSVCWYCGTICCFDKELNLAPASLEQLERLRREDPDTYMQMMAAHRAIKQRIQKT